MPICKGPGCPFRNTVLQASWQRFFTLVVYCFNSAFWFPRVPAKTYSVHGGAGALISVGLLRRVPYEHMHRCIQEAYSSGGDGMVTECLWEVHPFLPALSVQCCLMLCKIALAVACILRADAQVHPEGNSQGGYASMSECLWEVHHISLHYSLRKQVPYVPCKGPRNMSERTCSL